MQSSTLPPQLDDAVDEFEEGWGLDSFRQMDAVLAAHGLGCDAEWVAELLRVDIQRRYAAGIDVSLPDYFDVHPAVRETSRLACQVAYEDYRTRVGRSLSVAKDRWSWIEGIEAEGWYQRLASFGSRTSSDDSLRKVSSSAQAVDSLKTLAERSTVVLAELPVEPADLGDAIHAIGFRVVREIGAGAFSRVFLATQNDLAHRYVVLKAVLRTFNEPDRLAQLQHTNIVPIYSFHQSGRWSFICMPYTGLITLADYYATATGTQSRCGQSFVDTLRQAACVDTLRDSQRVSEGVPDSSSLSLDDRSTSVDSLLSSLESMPREALGLWIFSHLSSALAHAHARNVLHGDLKPANILLRNDGEPSLMDFNLSTVLDGRETSTVGGTLPYMAPELMKSLVGGEHRASLTSDIYSLGAVFYEFLTGRLAYPPPRSAAPVDLELAIADRQKPVAWKSMDNVSPGLQAIVARCLAPTADDRYKNAEELREDIDRELSFRPLKYAREASWNHRLRKWTKRHPVVASTGTLAVASILVVTVLALGLWNINEHRRTLFAQRHFAEFTSQSRHALAKLLIVDRQERDEAIAFADECLDHYRLLSDSDWERDEAWSYLDASSRETAEQRLADLLLRTTWSRWEHRSDGASSSRAPYQQDLVHRVALLSRDSFKRHAPVSIDYLRRSIESDNVDAADDIRIRLDSDATPLDRLGKATDALQRLNSHEAMQWLTPDLLKSVDPYTYWVTLGRAQLLAGYYPSAELSFSMAIETEPRLPAAFHYRGVCRMKMRNARLTPLAISDFTSALERTGHAYETRINRAMAKESQGDLQGALDDLKSLSGEAEVDAQLLMVRSRVHKKLRDVDSAGRDFEAAMRIRPRSISAWMTRALARLPGDPQGAIEDLLAAQKLDPNSIEILQNLAHVQSEYVHATEQAVDTLTRLLSLNPTYERARLGRAVLYARLNQPSEALADLRLAQESRSSLAPASVYQAGCVYSLVARTYAETDRDDQEQAIKSAVGYLSRAIQQGYGADLLTTDPDLDPLRDDSRFQTIVSAVAMGRTITPQ